MTISQKVRDIAEANPNAPRKTIMALCAEAGIGLPTANSVYASWKNKFNADPILRDSKLFGEENDSAVVTIAKVCDTDYTTTHAVFKEAGRRNKRRYGITNVFEKLSDFVFKPVSVEAETVQDATKLLNNGKFIVTGTGFEFGIVDGKPTAKDLPLDKKVTGIFEVQGA